MPLDPTARSLLALFLAAAACGCGPSPDAPLPPESDLYAYSLAVAEKARLKVGTGNARALFAVGRVHERFGLEDNALELYRRVVEMDANIGEVYRRVGFILSQRKDKMGQAIEAYQQSLRCEPGASGVSTRIGLVLTHQGRLDEALRALSDEVRAGTADGDTYYNLGQAYALQGKHPDAVDSYKEAIRRMPGSRSAYYSLVQSYRSLQKTAEAEEAQRKFLEIKAKEDEETAKAAGTRDNRHEQVRFAAEAWMDAAALFVAEVNGSKEPAHRARFTQEFLAAAGEAKRIDPTYLDPHTALVNYYKGRKEWASAVRECEEALKVIPGNADVEDSAFQIGGSILEEAAQAPNSAAGPDLVLGLFRSVVAANPGHSDAHREIAKVILFRLKDRLDLIPAALQHAQKALDLLPTARNYDILAYAYFRMGQREKACSILEEGVKHNPDDEGLANRLRNCRGP